MSASILMFYKLSPLNEIDKKNGFVRKLVSPRISITHEVLLPDESFDFIGRIDSGVLLTSYLNKRFLFKVNYALNKLDTVDFNYHAGFNTSTNIYSDSKQSDIYVSNPFGDISVSNGNKKMLFKLTGLRIDNFQAISSKTVIARARHYYGQELNRSFAKLSLSSKVKIDKEYLLPEEVNGFFTNDGWLVYDRSRSVLIYSYYYRGEFLCLDTNLNLLYKAKTIDTVRIANIKIGMINSKAKNGQVLKEITPVTPPKFVSRYVTTDGNNVYVLSALKSDNENKSSFLKNQLIDVYDISNGTYRYSFYIPKYRGVKLHQFQIKNNILIALFGAYLVSYNFSD